MNVKRERSGECFAFTGFHFRNGAMKQSDSAQDLAVKMAHAEAPPTSLTNKCIGFPEDGLKRLARFGAKSQG
jgi:hypothetical protein